MDPVFRPQGTAHRVVPDSLLEGRDVPVPSREGTTDAFRAARQVTCEVGGHGGTVGGPSSGGLAGQQDIGRACTLAPKLFFSGEFCLHEPSGGTKFKAQSRRPAL